MSFGGDSARLEFPGVRGVEVPDSFKPPQGDTERGTSNDARSKPPRCPASEISAGFRGFCCSFTGVPSSGEDLRTFKPSKWDLREETGFYLREVSLCFKPRCIPLAYD